MKKIRIYISVLAVLIVIAIMTAAFGVEKLVAFERNAEMKEESLSITLPKGNNADAEMEFLYLDKRRKAVKSRENGEIPFLVKGIKYKCIESNEAIVFVNSNQKLEYNIPLEVCVSYVYDCPAGAPRLDIYECEVLAREAVYSVFSGFKNFIITKSELTDNSDKTCTFAVMTTLTDDGVIEISLRKDTGSVVFYDARECIEIIESNLGRK